MTFSPIPHADLEQLVNDVLDDYTVNENDFTAYDITLLLRQDNPTTEIMHSVIRQIVHDSMWTRIQSGLPYSAEQRDYNGQTALTYFYQDPAAITVDDVVTGSVPTPPTLLDWDSFLN